MRKDKCRKIRNKCRRGNPAFQEIQQTNSAAVLFSGGKDSCLALFKAAKKFDIRCLLTILPEDKDSFMFHQPDLKLLKKQAQMLNLPLLIQKTKGIEDKELKDLEKLIEKVKNKAKVLVVGGLASNYQSDRIKKIAENFGLMVYAPLWGYSAEKLWQELLNNKFEVIITKISCEGLNKKFLGKIINKKTYKELKELSEKFKFRLDFEGGEAETSVLWMPLFKKKINIKGKAKSEGNYRHFFVIER